MPKILSGFAWGQVVGGHAKARPYSEGDDMSAVARRKILRLYMS